MSLTGKNTLSLRRQDVMEQKSIAVGFQKLTFAHKATLGDTGINLTSLTTPTEMSSVGFINPNTGDLIAANLLFYRRNLTLVSSLRGVLMDYLSYDVRSSSRINFQGFTALENEIFIGIIDPVPKTELRSVDATPIVATGELAVGVTDFNVGVPFETNKYPTYQAGAVQVFRNGVQQFRNPNNGTTGGNYQEVNNGSGLGTVIRFNNAPVGSSDSILVVGTSLLTERPDGSMMAVIEGLAGQIDAMIPTLADLAGVPETNFQAAPNNVDLKQFGDTVLTLQANAAKATIACQVALAADFAASANAVVKFDTILDDPYGCYSPSTGLFTVPIGGAGLYRISASHALTASVAGTSYFTKNGVQQKAGASYNGQSVVSGSTVIRCADSDTLSLYSNAGGLTFDGLAAPYVCHMSIERIGN